MSLLNARDRIVKDESQSRQDIPQTKADELRYHCLTFSTDRIQKKKNQQKTKPTTTIPFNTSQTFNIYNLTFFFFEIYGVSFSTGGGGGHHDKIWSKLQLKALFCEGEHFMMTNIYLSI